MRALDASRGTGPGASYPLDSVHLPFMMIFAQRRHIKDYPLICGASQSDGNTTSNDGNSGGQEEFDWLTDD